MNDRSNPERPAAPSLRERFRETTVQAILTAAEEVFADAGLHAAHMGEIAARAGVSVGTLYNHFADREALLGGLAAARFTEMLAHVDAALDQSEGQKFGERLEALVGAMLGHWEQHRKFMRIAIQGETGQYQKTFPTAYGTMRDKMREIYARVDKVTSQGVREKAIRADVADLAPFFLMGMIRSLIMRGLVVDEVDQSLSADAGRVVRAFLEGVAA
ncbi:MAG TPA: TetR/AcrR family transcriptional regulator [Polyangia bacterium]|nr:TetR/AcrR family transcriptional regulator [Polyangia bacterium]